MNDFYVYNRIYVKLFNMTCILIILEIKNIIIDDRTVCACVCIYVDTLIYMYI